MNSHHPMQILGGSRKGLWYWCIHNENSGQIRPEGYCSQGCEGHETPEEAREHMRQYLLDNCLRVHVRECPPEKESIRERCAVPGCEEYTDRFVEVGTGLPKEFPICKAHDARKAVEKIYELRNWWGSR